MTRFSFVTRIPDEPGALYRAAEIVSRYRGNINRIHYDRRIDPATVFFEVTCTDENYQEVRGDLERIGYLQTSLKPGGFLKFAIFLPHRPGTLFEFLQHTTLARANIAFMDFDDSGKHPDLMVVSLSVEDSSRVDTLLNALKSRYRLEIMEYDTTGNRLDDTVFYVWFAQQLREIIGQTGDDFLLRLLQDINHVVQELMNLGKDPKEVFQSILATGRTLRKTIGNGFYADVQQVSLPDDTVLRCFQLPGGGNVFLISTPGEVVMVDTGYGIYHQDISRMLSAYGFTDTSRLRRIIITHGDADHAGGAGYYDACATMHPTTLDIITRANRAYGSIAESSILEAVYTTLINAFSAFTIPRSIEVVSPDGSGHRGIFPILGQISIGNIAFEVLGSLGGHLAGQIYLLSRAYGLLFTADTVINFESLSRERQDYSTLAVNLVTSVNVDSAIARQERKALLEIARDVDAALVSQGKQCLICGGHGAISTLREDTLVSYGPIDHYAHPRRSISAPCDTSKR